MRTAQASVPEREQPHGERKFSQEQYDMLLRSSRKRDISDWNKWREQNPLSKVLLQGAELRGQHLEGAALTYADLQQAKLAHANLEGADLSFANLKCADLADGNLKTAYLPAAQLQQANLQRADLSRACLDGASLAGARAVTAGLAQASLCGANLTRADLRGCELRGAWATEADLRGATLQNADLREADLSKTLLGGAQCQKAVVDGATSLWDCTADRGTDFSGAGLESARMQPALRQLLQYNIRRMNWERWYKEHCFLKWLVRPFWWMSDYGLSTGRIIAVFFGLAILFAATYWIWSLVSPPCIVQNLLADRNGVQVPSALVPFRALYFSVVTMTTLGFGDMHAYAASFWGHLLLMVQVLLGYVLLAALVTRFAILFTAGGPAGKFSKPEKQPNRTERGDRGEDKPQMNAD